MRLELILAGLAAFAAAAPIEKAAADVSYSSYTPYKTYALYGPYSAAVDEEAAKMNDALNTKRTTDMNQASNSAYSRYSSYTPYSSYSPYSAAVAAEAAKMDLSKRIDQASNGAYNRYTTYTPYASYSPYSADVAAEAAKMDIAKRAETMTEMEEMKEEEMTTHEMVMKRKRNNMMDEDILANPTASCETSGTKEDADIMKRDMPIMTEAMMTDTTMGMDANSMKRSINHPNAAEMARPQSEKTDGSLLPDNWYGKYDPYSSYDTYPVDKE